MANNYYVYCGPCVVCRNRKLEALEEKEPTLDLIPLYRKRNVYYIAKHEMRNFSLDPEFNLNVQMSPNIDTDIAWFEHTYYCDICELQRLYGYANIEWMVLTYHSNENGEEDVKQT